MATQTHSTISATLSKVG